MSPDPRRRIPEATVTRLPVYQRLLGELVRSGTATVSSEQLAELARVNASKVRKDLSFFGSFGTRGSGYDTEFLLAHIERELGLQRDWPVVIVGIGNLGRALANSQGFTTHGFRVWGLYDVDSTVIGSSVGATAVRHLDGFADDADGSPPAIGVIATPATAAQEVAELLVGAGVGSLLNFAPQVLHVPATVLLRYVDLSIELQVMSFYLSHSEHESPPAASSLVPHTVGLSAADPG